MPSENMDNHVVGCNSKCWQCFYHSSVSPLYISQLVYMHFSNAPIHTVFVCVFAGDLEVCCVYMESLLGEAGSDLLHETELEREKLESQEGGGGTTVCLWDQLLYL